jgi:endoglucanase
MCCLTAPLPAGSGQIWPLWESYARHFVSGEGRVVDYDAKDRTTSEAQSYSLFFALVANDRQRFEKILGWTNANLAQGDLGNRLPAWLWGKTATGGWFVQDPNPASDSDLWIAYTLLEAASLWDESSFESTGRALAERIAIEEVLFLEGLGPTLLPGPEGFHPKPGVYQLNASYSPLQVLLGLSRRLPDGPWAAMAQHLPKLVAGSSRRGVVLDWVAYREKDGFHDSPLPRPEAVASFDAIRVYLWAGMLDPQTPGRDAILESIQGLARHLLHRVVPPAVITAAGKVRERQSGPGFSAAAIPYLEALGQKVLADQQRQRLASFLDASTGLYASPPRYYDQNLALFATGWSEGRFRFGADGALIVPWKVTQ